MTNYKIFILNSEGRIYRVVDIAAGSDDEILDELTRREEPYGCEVWAGDRMVAKFGGVRSAGDPQ
jgi:hypothetical protein